MTYDDIKEFQEKIAEPFISHLKGNILSLLLQLEML